VSQSTTLSLLERISLFSELDSSERADVLSLARPFAFTSGHTIFHQGDKSDGMYVIERGKVRIWTRLLDNEEVDISTLGGGDVVGEFSLIDYGERSATAFTLEASSGFFIGSRHFEVLRADLHPAAFKTMRRISRELSERLRTVDSQMASKSPPPTVHPLPRWVGGPAGAAGTVREAATLNRGVLRALPFFRTLSDDELKQFLSVVVIRELPKGEILFRQREPGRSCFVVVRGAVQVAMEIGAGTENVAVIGPGKMFGLDLVDGGARGATCYARERTLLLEISQEQFGVLFEGNSAIAFKFYDAINQNLVEQLRASNRRLGWLEAVERALSAAR
jgi:CRP/FNR family transcriptional regulator, cyclic AMP receptor protein